MQLQERAPTLQLQPRGLTESEVAARRSQGLTNVLPVKTSRCIGYFLRKLLSIEEKRRCWRAKKQAKTRLHCLQSQECLMPTNTNELCV